MLYRYSMKYVFGDRSDTREFTIEAVDEDEAFEKGEELFWAEWTKEEQKHLQTHVPEILPVPEPVK